MSPFGYRDKFHTTDDQHLEDHADGEQLEQLEQLEEPTGASVGTGEGTGEGTGPALEEPTGNPDPDGILDQPAEQPEHVEGGQE